MDAETLQALKDSIAKWEKNARVRKVDSVKVGAANCPLCLLYNTEETRAAGYACHECPVMAETEYGFCEFTPYEDAERAFSRWHHCQTVELAKDFRAAARAEVDFLKSLLPEAQS